MLKSVRAALGRVVGDLVARLVALPPPPNGASPAVDPLPSEFADRQAQVDASAHHSLIEDLEDLGRVYRPDVDYDVPLVRAQAAHHRAEKQLARLDYARRRLLEYGTNLLRALSERDALVAQGLPDHNESLRAAREDVAAAVKLFDRTLRWCADTSDVDAWSPCDDCPHYLFEHAVDGGCQHCECAHNGVADPPEPGSYAKGHPTGCGCHRCRKRRRAARQQGQGGSQS
jgi:hypothetical protein